MIRARSENVSTFQFACESRARATVFATFSGMAGVTCPASSPVAGFRISIRTPPSVRELLGRNSHKRHKKHKGKLSEFYFVRFVPFVANPFPQARRLMPG